jgi:ribosomal protein S18 acetylase RimI-like enzyme
MVNTKKMQDSYRWVIKPTSQYTVNGLADIYNRGRIDYIVPMPMNGKRMAEYIDHYDIDLGASFVVHTETMGPIGLLMLGIREDRAWVTRMGIDPDLRGFGLGKWMMGQAFQSAAARGVNFFQLEVIKGNKPATALFHHAGFIDQRELLIIRRPPGIPRYHDTWGRVQVKEIPQEAFPALLAGRDHLPAWTEEAPSFLNTKSLHGIQITLADGESGWIIYHRTNLFQITHVALSPQPSRALATALIYQMHNKNPAYDTKIENLPAAHPTWRAFEKLGYVESFRRIEMLTQRA